VHFPKTMKRFFKYLDIVMVALVGVFVVIGIIANHSLTPQQRTKIAASRVAADANRDQERAAARLADEARAKKEASEKQHYRATHADIRAFSEAKDYVRRRLKSPTSSDFASMDDSTIVNHGEGKYLVRSFVNSQNTFGAKIRTEYFCEMITADGERFIVTDLITEP
jgi:hypothetical protein